MTDLQGSLAGLTVAITASRRAEDAADALRRHGAEVIVAPTMCTAPLADDAGLIRATERVLQNPPDFVLVTTATGFRGWLEAADTMGTGDELRDLLADARIVARGPKATGAIRAAGLREEWSSPTETTIEALSWLAESGGRESRIAVQLHGDPDPEWLPLLHDLAAEVESVPVYRWLPAPDPQAVANLIDWILAGSVDAIVFTSAPAVEGLFEAASTSGHHDELVAALRSNLLVASVGPVTAKPLERLGISSIQPERARLGALNRLLVTELGKLGPEQDRQYSGDRNRDTVRDQRREHLPVAPINL